MGSNYYILLFVSFLLFTNSASAQTWEEKMFDPGVNVYTVVLEAEEYFQNIDKKAKGSGWKTYQRWLFENEPKFYPSDDRSNVDPYFASNSYKAFKKNYSSVSKALLIMDGRN